KAKPLTKSQQAQDGNGAMFSRRDAKPVTEADRQFKETERAYGGREAYDRAKAAGKTKLTYGQWVQVRTPNFKAWFGDWESDPENASKVVDSATGEPLVVYHGTSGNEGGDAFTYFDTYASNYGLMGQGAYFTDNPEVASSYTSKGKGETPTVYKVFLSIQNPIDMDAKADPAKWQKQFDGIEDFHEGGETNESWYRAAEDLLRDQGLPMWEGAETMLFRGPKLVPYLASCG
ncbi:MAG: hypothetical protein LC106_01280, partial [Burkholderiales bacterium]|nr:hypothetical protein [Burkholderiales bacterium]